MSAFYWIPAYGFEITKEPKLTEAAFGDGYSQRVGKGINNNPQMWNLSFNGVSDAVADDIEAFHDSKASGTSFTWTPPKSGSTEIKVMFKSFSRTYSIYNKCDIRITFKQVFGE
jgi:phage-related protein